MEQKEKEEEERKQQQAILKQCKDSDIQRLGEKVRESELLAIKREEMNVFRLHEEVLYLKINNFDSKLIFIGRA